MSNYRDMHLAMANFCNWLQKSSVSEIIHGQTSMHLLSVFQLRFEGSAHVATQRLEINPNFETRQIEFRFVDTYLEKHQWYRVEPAEPNALVMRLVGFMNQVGWSRLSAGFMDTKPV